MLKWAYPSLRLLVVELFKFWHLSDQGTFTPVGAQGSSLRKPLSSWNFAMKFAPYMHYKKES